MITFKGIVRQRKNGEVYMDLFEIDRRRETVKEKELFDEDILSLADGALDIDGNYLLNFGG